MNNLTIRSNTYYHCKASDQGCEKGRKSFPIVPSNCYDAGPKTKAIELRNKVNLKAVTAIQT